MQDIISYNQIVRKLRTFFQDHLEFIEVPAQSRLSILAACEDPSTITQFSFNNINYPLPQTGQMWLEAEILKNPQLPGVFCITTSYRNEANPIEGRHERVFPMFEFEAHGSLQNLRQIESDLIKFLGFNKPFYIDYETAAERYNTSILSAEHELKMQQDLGDVISLEHFPKRTHPFWNMKQGDNGLYQKIDVLLHGMETIGSAERSSNAEQMRESFHTISYGQYADLLFKAFGKERVLKELDQYLSHDFFPRFGAGIGITRLSRAMHLAQLLTPSAIAA